MLINNSRTRKVALREISGESLYVELFKGSDLYGKLGMNRDKYGVNIGSNYVLKVDMLLKEPFNEKFFYINPKIKYEVVYCEYYDDFWFLKSMEGVSRKSDKLVTKCRKVLKKSGVSDDSLVAFIMREDDKYHLEIDGEDCGFLGDDSNDIEFKKMITSVIKDVKYNADVIVLPSTGENFFFKDTVAVYKRKSDFVDALDRKIKVLNGFGDITEKEIAVTSENKELIY